MCGRSLQQGCLHVLEKVVWREMLNLKHVVNIKVQIYKPLLSVINTTWRLIVFHTKGVLPQKS